MEKLLQRLQKPLVSSSVLPVESAMPPSRGNEPHTPSLSTHAQLSNSYAVQPAYSHLISQAGKITLLIVYVDDIFLFGDDTTENIQVMKNMGDKFETKDLENLKYFLGMEVARSKEGISVSQRKKTDGRAIEAKIDSDCARSNAEAEYKGSISIANNPVQHDITKHVEIDRHFIKERLDNGSIHIPYIPSSYQDDDVLTKGLLRQSFDSCVSKLGLIDIYISI
ncbi:Retrovirus-related Pol polyprotein from transposon TNT 1-94 [Cucumis melo var. makuwa]|uniref:Retrovirus-related Pol polyprotein from transposon TNT 1-94 n=1 Tax=Cucumis melo var. makuwa TaxID=1194695 RepID=A0A5D3C8Y7_CUCMM|nr:Retrovirus-related Pol polyprotein from transposon TNT 1-94 [Cucumis melo var. makuwa]TYK08427.1 Retrovirus-related Pol polyprotein from transposon TNT 1-94 [Cucumis melo var. makuwa]